MRSCRELWEVSRNLYQFYSRAEISYFGIRRLGEGRQDVQGKLEAYYSGQGWGLPFVILNYLRNCCFHFVVPVTYFTGAYEEEPGLNGNILVPV